MHIPPQIRDALFMLNKPEDLDTDQDREYRRQLLKHRGLPDHVLYLQALGFDGLRKAAILSPKRLELEALLQRAQQLESALTDEDLASNSPALAESKQALKDYHNALEKAFA